MIIVSLTIQSSHSLQYDLKVELYCLLHKYKIQHSSFLTMTISGKQVEQKEGELQVTYDFNLGIKLTTVYISCTFKFKLRFWNQKPQTF